MDFLKRLFGGGGGRDDDPSVPAFDPDEALAAAGWDAITEATRARYGDQEPLHWGTLISFALGGPDPLDGISAYRAEGPPAHWHFVTYGLTELDGKVTEDPELSGWGFELTLRLARDADEEPPDWAPAFLQGIARYVVDGHGLLPGQRMQLGPPMRDPENPIPFVVLVEDPQLGTIDTPNGRVTFIQLVGVTAEQHEAAANGAAEAVLEPVRLTDPLLVTDPATGTLAG